MAGFQLLLPWRDLQRVARGEPIAGLLAFFTFSAGLTICIALLAVLPMFEAAWADFDAPPPAVTLMFIKYRLLFGIGGGLIAVTAVLLMVMRVNRTTRTATLVVVSLLSGVTVVAVLLAMFLPYFALMQSLSK